MRIKLLLATLVGAFAINGAVAGTCNYCPPPSNGAKCPVDCCEDSPGYVGVAYMSDYFFRGVRYSRDAVAMTASYTFDACCIPITFGVNHVTSLSSRAENSRIGNGSNSGDQTDAFAEIALPGFCGVEAVLRYDHYFYPNLRQPSGTPGNNVGDSHGALSLTLARELFCGVVMSYTRTHDFNAPAATAFANPGYGVTGNNLVDEGAWIHTLGLDKSFCISDCVSLDLSGGVLYTDNMWAGGSGAQRASGWNSYYIEAGLPISIGRCAVLTPYLGYNGTPDSWLADDITSGLGAWSNRNDVFHGGVRLGVNF